MVKYLTARADEELHPLDISIGAWWAHFKRTELHEIDERDENGVGLIRLRGELPYMRGEVQFQMPEDGKYSEIVWLPTGRIASTSTNAGTLTGLPNTYRG